MQALCCEMPWCRTLRAVALILTIVLGLEWTSPLGGIAQSNPEPASAPSASVENQESPPTQEAPVTEEPTPFYKEPWFVIIVVVVMVAVVAVVAAATDGSGICGNACGAPPSAAP